MALTPGQVYKLGAEALGWNNSTAAGKASIAEDMKLLKRLQVATAKVCCLFTTNAIPHRARWLGTLSGMKIDF